MALPDKINLPDRRNYSNAVYPSDSSSMDWLGTTLGAAGGLFSSFFSNRSINKQIKAQQRENELNRQFNSAEAQKSRDFASLMFDRENAYNDPKSVIQRLQTAGINPALAYGSFADSSSISSNAAASSSGSITPSPLDSSGIVSAGRSYLDSRLVEAQSRLANSEAAKNEAETPWIDKMQDAKLQKIFTSIGVDVSSMRLNDAQGNQLYASAENLRKQIDLFDSQIGVNKADAALKASTEEYQSILNKYADESQRLKIAETKASIKHLFSWANLNDAQATQIMQLLPYVVTSARNEAWQSNEDRIITAKMHYEGGRMDGKSRHQIFADWNEATIEAKVEALRASSSGRDVDFLEAFLGTASNAVQVAMWYSMFKSSKKPPMGFK